MVCGPYVVTLFTQTPILEWYMARLVLKNGHWNDMCYDEIQLCAQNSRHHSRFNSVHIYWEGLFDRLKRKTRIITLTSYNFQPGFWSLEWQSSSCMAIANWMRQFPVWFNCQNYLWNWKRCPQMGCFTLKIDTISVSMFGISKQFFVLFRLFQSHLCWPPINLKQNSSLVASTISTCLFLFLLIFFFQQRRLPTWFFLFLCFRV